MPVVPTVSAKVCFMNFKKNIQLNDDLFRVPSDYAEDMEAIFTETKNSSTQKNS